MENEAGNMIIVKGRDELNEFKTCGKLKGCPIRENCHQ